MSEALQLINAALLRSPFSDPELQAEVRGAIDEVKYWWGELVDVFKAPDTVVALKGLARRLGQPYETVRGRYYKWKKADYSWKALINRAKFPARRRSPLPPAFVQYWQDLCLSNQRENSALGAHELLLAQLEIWEKDPFNPEKAIPGYSRPPKRQRKSRLPASWSYRSLIRLLPDKYVKTLIKQGAKAASEYLPSIPSSRVYLGFGQYFYFDDSLHDTYINLTGVNGKAMRPLSFNCVEALSGSLCEMLLKPQIEGPDGRVELNQLDFFWFVIHQLTNRGYNADCGTVLVFEHRTANVDKDADFDNMIAQVTGDKVRIDRSGRFGKPAFKGMLFGGQPSGNFRFKAPIESFFNLVRNRAGWLEAPTGLSPEKAPEESYGLLQYNDRLQGMIDKLPPSVFLSLQRPVLEWEAYTHAARIVHDFIDYRRNHSLEGWAKLNFMGHRYRLSLDTENWIGEREYLSLPNEQRSIMDQIVRKPGYFDSFKLSPREVFDAHAHLLTKLPLSAVPLLAPPRAWLPVTVSQSFEMTIKDPFVDPEPLTYWATLKNSHGHEVHLQRGQTYLRLLNPFDPSRIWIAEADGSRKGQLIGMAEQVHSPNKLDGKTVTEIMGEYNHLRANQSKSALVHLAPEAARRVEMHQHNKRAMAGKPVTAEGIAREKDLHRFARKEGNAALDGMLDQQPEESPAPPAPSSRDESLIDDLLA